MMSQQINNSGASGKTTVDKTQLMDCVNQFINENEGVFKLNEEIDLLEGLRSTIYLWMLGIIRETSKNTSIQPTLWFRISGKFKALNNRLQSWQEYHLLRIQSHRCDIIFYPYEKTHVQVLVPVIKELKRLQKKLAAVSSKEKILDSLRKQGMKPMHTRVISGKVTSCPFLVQPENLNPDSLNQFLNLANNRKKKELLMSRLCEVINLHIPKAVENFHLVDNMVKYLNPRMLVVGNDLTLEGRVAALRAKTLGVPTACLMHGAVSGDPMQAWHVVDSFLVFGEAAKRTLEASKSQKTNTEIIVSGPPHLDNLIPQTGIRGKCIEDNLGITSEQHYLLIATSGPGHGVSSNHHQALIKALAAISNELTDVEFVIKLHRKDSYSFYEPFLETTRLKVVEDAERGFPKRIYDWLQGCDLVLTGGSTVAYESMLMRVPVITVDLCHELSNVDFIKEGITKHATSERILKESIRELIFDRSTRKKLLDRQQKFIDSYFQLNDGHSAKRCAEVLLQHMKNE